jgi:hypothetical protein
MRKNLRLSSNSDSKPEVEDDSYNKNSKEEFDVGEA